MNKHDHFYTSNSLQLFYKLYTCETEHHPQTVLCLPGLTRNHRDFEAIAEHLSKNFTVICPDMRGRGRSDYDSDISNYNSICYVQDMWKLLDTIKVSSVNIIGTSLGGIMAMHMANQQAARIEKIILNDIGAFVEPGPIETIFNAVKAAKALNDWNEAITTLKAQFGDTFTNLTQKEWLEFAKRLYREKSSRIIPDHDLSLGDSLNPQALDLWPLFDGLASVPTLVLRGANSDLLTPVILEDMQRQKPDLVCAEIPHRGHSPFLDEQEAIKAIDLFLST